MPILVHKCSLVNFWFIECICTGNKGVIKCHIWAGTRHALSPTKFQILFSMPAYASSVILHSANIHIYVLNYNLISNDIPIYHKWFLYKNPWSRLQISSWTCLATRKVKWVMLWNAYKGLWLSSSRHWMWYRPVSHFETRKLSATLSTNTQPDFLVLKHL